MILSEIKSSKIPDHVPAELVWDHSLDAFNRELGDPFLAASRLHDGPEMLWVTDAAFGKPAWVPTRHALIEAAFLDYAHFSSRDYFVPPVPIDNWRLIPLEVDPPEHHQYRKILSPFFTPAAVRNLDHSVQDVCDSLIRAFEKRGSCEFISEFALVFPNAIFLSLMGMPQDMLPQFLRWEHSLLRGQDQAERVQAAEDVFRYLEGFLSSAGPGARSALVEAIVNGEIHGRRLTMTEQLGICFLLYMGGLDTVYSTLGWMMRSLAGDPALQNRLRREPERIPAAVEEFARAFAVPTMHRTVTEDFDFHGAPLKRGDSVLLAGYLAARDLAAYDNPHSIDIDRKARNITFATGPHICLGIHLAKRELRTVLEAFVTRFPNIRIADGESYRYHTGTVFGVDYLPLAWD